MEVCKMTDDYKRLKLSDADPKFVDIEPTLLANVNKNITFIHNATPHDINLTEKKKLNNKQCTLPATYIEEKGTFDKEENYKAIINSGMYVGTELEGRYWKMTPFFLPQYKQIFTLTRKKVGPKPTTAYIQFNEVANYPNDYSNFDEYTKNQTGKYDIIPNKNSTNNEYITEIIKLLKGGDPTPQSIQYGLLGGKSKQNQNKLNRFASTRSVKRKKTNKTIKCRRIIRRSASVRFYNH